MRVSITNMDSSNSSTPTVAEVKIDKLANSVGSTDLGNSWLKTALDPFPDEPRKCGGFPDMVSGPSVVQKLKYQTTQVVPASVASGKWDCHIYFDGFDNDVPLWVTHTEGNPDYIVSVAGQLNANVHGGGLCVRAGAAGTQLTLPTLQQNLPIPVSYFLNGKTRVIAKAFEVHNQTETLYKSGASTFYRSPSKRVERYISITKNLISPITAGNVMKAVVDYDIPELVSPIMNLDDTVVGNAEDGCYCVSTLNGPDLRPLDFNDVCYPMEIDSAGLYSGQLVPNPSGFSYQNVVGAFPGEFNLSGAWFTGLSYETTLTIVVHYVIERFVNENSLDLVVMTTKSPCFDPAVLELYSRAASAIPTGVPVSANADGDWIKNIADVLGSFGVPGMALVKGGVDLWNGSKTTQTKSQKDSENARIAQLEKKIALMSTPDTNKRVQPQPRKITGETKGQKKQQKQIVKREVKQALEKEEQPRKLTAQELALWRTFSDAKNRK
jgi:hypothetical protein